MLRDHHFKTLVTWAGNRGSGTMDYRSYERDFVVNADGKPELKGSSASVFLGDETAYSPEDLLLAAVSSCHMLWFLHLCADNNIVVLEYRDRAVATLAEHNDGSGHFSKIELYPEVVVSKNSNTALANKLHETANNMCFIANSLKSEIVFKPTCTNG